MNNKIDILIAMQEQQIKMLTEQIEMLKKIKNDFDEESTKNAKMYREYINKTLTKEARDRGLKQIAKNRKNKRAKIVQWIEHYLYTTGNKEVDMCKLIAEVDTSESTVRNLMREIKRGIYIVEEKDGTRTFYKWLRNGCKFKNVPNFHK